MIVNEPHSVSEHGSIILTLNELDARAICRPLIRELRVFEHEINSPSDARDYRRGEQFVVLLAKVLEGEDQAEEPAWSVRVDAKNMVEGG